MKAVKHRDGPALVVSGPGSGKTKVITHRVAYLLSKGADPSTIVAVTFTNRAANEMKSRVEDLVGKGFSRGLTCSTFHSYCWRLIRKWSKASMGWGEQELLNPEYELYSICAEDDVLSVVESVILDHFGLAKKERADPANAKALGVDKNLTDTGWVRREISNVKQNLLTPVEWKRQVKAGETYLSQGEDSKYARSKRAFFYLYRNYQKALKRQRLFDFDDLLFVIARELRTNRAFRERLVDSIDYLLVDEYQDTNTAQFEICEHLVDGKSNIFVVGDADQGVYSWRGADHTNVERFRKTFKHQKVKTFFLEKNFRSTKPITDVANELIAFNKDRIEKTIEPVKQNGAMPQLHIFDNTRQEASVFANSIKGDLMRKKVEPKDVALLYRTKVQSRALEEQFIRLNIPYRIVGSLSFYERKIIKDVLAFAKLLYNQKDDTSFGRIFNYPTRGLGKAALAVVDAIAKEKGCSRLEVFKYREYEEHELVSKRQLDLFRKLRSIFRSLIKTKRVDSTAARLIQNLVTLTGIEKEVTATEGKTKQTRKQDQKKWDHIQELIRAADEFVEDQATGSTLKDYLDWISLVQTQDDEEEVNRVTLMTCHAAKGLEFKRVYVCGCSNLNLPHYRSAFAEEPWSKNRSSSALQDLKRFKLTHMVKGLEEERRLFYVAVTRAEKELHVGAPISISRGHMDMIVGPSLFCFETWDQFKKVTYGTNRWTDLEGPTFLWWWHAASTEYMGPIYGHQMFKESMKVIEEDPTLYEKGSPELTRVKSTPEKVISTHASTATESSTTNNEPRKEEPKKSPTRRTSRALDLFGG